MVVKSTHKKSALIVKYQAGVTASGGPLIHSKTLGNIKQDADHEAVYEVAMALFGLSSHPVTEVLLQEGYELSEEDEDEN